jgi:hypothetical protein
MLRLEGIRLGRLEKNLGTSVPSPSAQEQADPREKRSADCGFLELAAKHPEGFCRLIPCLSYAPE